ncbi:MAG: hypothetical protein IPI79_11885 [Moraxellaceae bacterium]|nr:hypothetical protein [Moraxellaceae bacterium]
MGNYDNDGDIDVVIANNQDKPSFYTNQISGKAGANFINLTVKPRAFRPRI